MTCIAAVKHNQSVWIGGDSLACAGLDLIFTKEGKVWAWQRHGTRWVFGSAGHACVGKVLRYCGDLPDSKGSIKDPLAFLVRECAPRWRETLEKHKVSFVKESKFSTESVLVVGVLDRIFELDGSFDVTEINRPYFAIGSGRSAALGALRTAYELKPSLSPRRKIGLAIRAAAEDKAGIGAEFSLVHT